MSWKFNQIKLSTFPLVTQKTQLKREKKNKNKLQTKPVFITHISDEQLLSRIDKAFLWIDKKKTSKF